MKPNTVDSVSKRESRKRLKFTGECSQSDLPDSLQGEAKLKLLKNHEVYKCPQGLQTLWKFVHDVLFQYFLNIYFSLSISISLLPPLLPAHLYKILLQSHHLPCCCCCRTRSDIRRASGLRTSQVSLPNRWHIR